MYKLTAEHHQQRTEGGRILEEDGHGPKVLQLIDGTMAKLFRRRPGLSSDKLRPYSLRFMRNALKLKWLGIETLTPIERYRVIGEQLDVVIYQPLPGSSLKDLCRKQPEIIDSELASQLGQYIAELHEKGIFFRSLHLGNILRMDNGQFGLIDIADLKIQRSSLSSWQRLRNFKHLVRMTEYKKPLKNQSDILTDSYLSHCSGCSESFKKQLNQLLAHW